MREPDSILSKLIGSEERSVQDKLLRQQLTLQVFMPIGLRVLKSMRILILITAKPV